MKILSICGIALSLGLTLGAAYAAPLTVINPGFEEVYTDSSMTTVLPLALGSYVDNVGNGTRNDGVASYVPGWLTCSNWQLIVMNPSDAQFDQSSKTGYAGLCLGGWAVNILQSFTIQPGTYTVSLNSGGRFDNWDIGTLDLSLRPVSGDWNNEISQTKTLDNPVISRGTWTTYTTQYTVDADSPYIGQQMMIYLNFSGGHKFIDDVSVDYTPTNVPELPSSILAVVGIISTFGTYIRRRAI